MQYRYTAIYTPLTHGYMGQLVGWPEVVTEGEDLADCRAMLQDALQEMILANQALGRPIPFDILPALKDGDSSITSD